MKSSDPTADLRMELFPTTPIKSPTGSLNVPCELITAGLAITPVLDLVDGVYRLGGGFALTHTISGRLFTHGQACLECARETGRRLAETGISWTLIDFGTAGALKTSLADQYEAVIAALHLFGKCAQQMCFHDDEPCDACGMARQHAPYCIYVVGPMVAEQNAKVEAARAVTAR